MANPTKKNPELEKSIEEMFGMGRQDNIMANRCTSCGKRATKFRNAISEKEFTISGFCQVCQDSVFGID